MSSSEYLSYFYRKRLCYSWRSVSFWWTSSISDGCSCPIELAVLIDDPNAHQPPSAEALEHWNMEREASAIQQIAISEAERASDKATKLSSSEEAIRKRKEREAKRAAAALAKAIAEGISAEELAQASSDRLVEERPATPSKPAAPTFNVTIPASSSELEWYAPRGHAHPTLASARAAAVWSYPTTPYERAKCRVFQDLWEKGNFMGGGIKFGGDFLVYPGKLLSAYG